MTARLNANSLSPKEQAMTTIPVLQIPFCFLVFCLFSNTPTLLPPLAAVSAPKMLSSIQCWSLFLFIRLIAVFVAYPI